MELLGRLREGKRPTFTSCCPAWINFAEKLYPEVLPYLSLHAIPPSSASAPSPRPISARRWISIPGACASYPSCPASRRRRRRARLMLQRDGSARCGRGAHHPRVRAAAQAGGHPSAPVWPPRLSTTPYMGSYSGAGAIFGTTGGVMEAAVRSMHYLATGTELQGIEVTDLRGFEQVREARVDLGGPIGEVRLAHVPRPQGACEPWWRMCWRAGRTSISSRSWPAPAVAWTAAGHLRSKKAYLPHALKRREAIYAVDRSTAGAPVAQQSAGADALPGLFGRAAFP